MAPVAGAQLPPKAPGPLGPGPPPQGPSSLPAMPNDGRCSKRGTHLLDPVLDLLENGSGYYRQCYRCRGTASRSAAVRINFALYHRCTNSQAE
jgi:hypothetical protein